MNGRAADYPATMLTAESSMDAEFEARLRECSSLAFRVAYGVLRHRQDAEDVAQDAFARAYSRFAQLRDRERFRAWLVRMTWRIAIDRRRGDRRRILREPAFQRSDEPTPEGAASAEERATRLWSAIDELSPKLRLVIVLAGIEGYDMEEVSRLLRLPVGTVKSRLFIARKKLAEKLQCLANDSTRR
jgi:RNA polymerase sigma-70 factor (ECF subfamily)